MNEQNGLNSQNLILGVPSKGRLMEQTSDYFAKLGLTFRKTGHERGYQGVLDGVANVDIAYLSASEIARHLQQGSIHLGVTGEDLIRETMSDADERCEILAKLGFGHADVIVAAPTCWIDVNTIADLEDAAAQFYNAHGRRLRVATKYMNLTRRFFAEHGMTSYRIVESLGATEGTPAAQTAEVIVDITSTGATLVANNLKILTDGVILPSEACLIAARRAEHTCESEAALQAIKQRIASTER
ncbi:MAG: ATP phosphoribosyltransferase [Alphaproteobacteria bacterium]